MYARARHAVKLAAMLPLLSAVCASSASTASNPSRNADADADSLNNSERTHQLVRPATFPPQQIARLDLAEPELIDALLDALPALSRYPRAMQPPQVVYLPTAELRTRACTIPCPVLAFYSGGREIFLDHSLNPLTSLFDRSILLHEMVHYLQAQQAEEMRALEAASARERCRIWYAREHEAYSAQRAFLGLVHSRASAGRVQGRSNC
jgi:hypothetical protein